MAQLVGFRCQVSVFSTSPPWYLTPPMKLHFKSWTWFYSEPLGNL